jgi:hypothetical protein
MVCPHPSTGLQNVYRGPACPRPAAHPPDGSFLTFSTAEADGTAAMTTESRREGDTTIAILGTERYEIPDAFVLGD